MKTSIYQCTALRWSFSGLSWLSISCGGIVLSKLFRFNGRSSFDRVHFTLWIDQREEVEIWKSELMLAQFHTSTINSRSWASGWVFGLYHVQNIWGTNVAFSYVFYPIFMFITIYFQAPRYSLKLIPVSVFQESELLLWEAWSDCIILYCSLLCAIQVGAKEWV